MIIEDQPVAEVMTDKATVQIPAMHSGTGEPSCITTAGEIAKVHRTIVLQWTLTVKPLRLLHLLIETPST